MEILIVTGICIIIILLTFIVLMINKAMEFFYDQLTDVVIILDQIDTTTRNN